MKRVVKLPSVANVAAGSSCSVNLPVGPTYEEIIIAVTNITNVQLSNLELRVNGKPVQRFKDLAELDAINQFYGRGAAANGIYKLHLARPEMQSVEQQMLTALGTADVATVTLHGDINAACVNPAIVCYARQSPGQALGLITKVKRFPFSSAVSGAVDIDNLPRPGSRIAAIHLVKSDITACEVDVDSIRVYDMPRSVAVELAKAYLRTFQANYMHIDFIPNGNIFEALRTEGVQDLRVRPTLGTSGAVDIIVEYLDALEGI